MEATQMPINRWVDEKTIVHIYNGILLGHEKEWNFTICNNRIDLEGIMPSEVNQAHKDKYHVISLMYNLKNKWAHKTEQTHRHAELTIARWQEGVMAGWKRWRD